MGGDVIPALTRQGVAHVYDFSKNVVPGQDERERGYWRDVGSLDAYLRRQHGPDRSGAGVQPLQRRLAGVHPSQGAAAGQGVAGGRRRAVVRRRFVCCARARSCRGRTSSARSSVPSVFIDHDAHVTDSILMEGVHVGAGARLRRCIIDKNVVVPDWARIGHDPVEDAKHYTISTNGIVVVRKGQVISR